MILYFHELKSDALLPPPPAQFRDPYDHTPFTPFPTENLHHLLERIAAHRESAHLPQILYDELRALVVSSLYESTPTHLKETYFLKRGVPPTLRQITSAAITLARELTHANAIPIKQREARANKCLDNCTFHRRDASWSKLATDVITKIAGLTTLTTTPLEKSLGTCTMCGGCALTPKVRLHIIPILAGLTPEKLDNLIRAYGAQSFDKCWIVNEALQDPISKDLLKRKLAAGQAQGIKFLHEYISGKVQQSKQTAKEKQLNANGKDHHSQAA